MTTNPIPLKAALGMLGLAPDRCVCRWFRRIPSSGPRSRRAGGRRPSGRPVRQLPQESEYLVPSNKLRVLPLGGLGEIGKNMTVVEYGGKIVIVDTG